jgi:hypothetical protein
MSNTGTVAPLLNVLLPVIVGGGIGIIAGSVGPYFIQRTKDAADRKRKRAEKMEELIGAVVEHYHWMGALRFFAISGQGNQPILSPMTKMEGIVSTYFPELEMLVRQFEGASNKYQIWILDVGQKRIRNEPGYEKLVGHDEVVTAYTEKKRIHVGA